MKSFSTGCVHAVEGDAICEVCPQVEVDCDRKDELDAEAARIVKEEADARSKAAEQA